MISGYNGFRFSMRYRGRVDLDTITGVVSETTIESIYSLIEPLKLGANVPEEVRSHPERITRREELLEKHRRILKARIRIVRILGDLNLTT
jgi:hypothetical protein